MRQDSLLYHEEVLLLKRTETMHYNYSNSLLNTVISRQEIVTDIRLESLPSV